MLPDPMDGMLLSSLAAIKMVAHPAAANIANASDDIAATHDWDMRRLAEEYGE